MAEKKKIWIQNSYRSGIEIIIRDEEKHTSKRYSFVPVSVDRMSGRTITDGFTVMDKEDFDLLKEKSAAFNSCIKSGKLIVYDTMPASAMSSVDRILMLQEENRALKAKVTELEAELAKTKKSGKTSDKQDKPVEAPADEKAADAE
jgi:hypothetical protein